MKKKPPAGMDMVEIRWKDHYEPAGDAWWMRSDALALKPHINVTVAYLVGESDDGESYIVTSSWAGDDQFNRPLVILKCCVTEFHVLSRSAGT